MFLTAPCLIFPYPSSNPAYRSMPSITTLYYRYICQIWNKGILTIFHVVCVGVRGGLRWFWVVCGGLGVVCGGLGWFAVVWGGLR